MKIQRFALFVASISLFVAGVPATAQATFTILGSFPMITATYGVGSIPLVPPTTNSPAPWSFTSSNPKVATITGKTINVVGTGSSTITASQAASGKYSARSRSTQIRVVQGTPTVGEWAPQSVPITQRSYTLVPPTSNSNGGWSFVSSFPDIATIVGTTITFHKGGSLLIYATQSGTPNWKSASATMKFTVATIAPIIGSFGDISIMKNSVVSLTLNPPTSTSNGWWTFTSSNPRVASVLSNIVTPLAYGTTVITATQNAVGDYGSATATMTLNIQGPVPTLGAFADVTAQLSSASLLIQPPTSTSQGGWSYVSSDPSTATISGAVATFLKPGVITITASQGPTSAYASPIPVSMKLTITGPPSIGAWADMQKVVKDPDFTLAPPTSTSPGAWTYTSSNPAIVEIDGGVAKIKGAGEATITATQSATPIFTPGSAQMKVLVFGVIPTIGTFAPIQASLGSTPIALKPPTSNSPGTWTYTSSDLKVAVVNDSSIVLVGVGTATIYATQSSSGIYSQSNTVQATVTVSAKGGTAPTPTLTPTPTPKPTPTLTPTPAPKSTPVVKPTVKPTPKVVQKPSLKVSVAKNVITVSVIGATATATINGVKAKIGKNTVPAGRRTVQVKIAGKVVYAKTFIIAVAKPAVRVHVARRVITIAVTGAKATATISGVKAKIGKNTVKAGKRTVQIKIAGKVVYTKTFTIK